MPRRAARARPETNAIGVARISGHGVATTSTARAATGEPDTTQPSAGDGERDRQEDHGGAVGEARRTRAVGFGLLHEVHDPRVVEAAAARSATTSIGSPDDARAAANLVAGGAARRQWLSRQRSLVEHRRARSTRRAVDRDDLAREDAQAIAGAHLGRRHVDEPLALVPMRHGRSAPTSAGQLAPGTPECALFEQLAAREHQRDDEPRLELSQQQRAGDGKQRDHVGAQLTVQHAPHDRQGERNDDRDQDDGPEHVCRVAMRRSTRSTSPAARARPMVTGTRTAAHGTILRAHAPAGIGALPAGRDA